MKIAIASDHAGVDMKDQLAAFLKKEGHTVSDLGPLSKDRVDYPDYAKLVADQVSNGEVARGVLVCGSGIGMAISANKVAGCRAVLPHNDYEAEMSRRHNNANIVCFGERSQGIEVVKNALKKFLVTEFEAGRHADRVDKINHLDGHNPVSTE